jgi:hypothetical protein
MNRQRKTLFPTDLVEGTKIVHRRNPNEVFTLGAPMLRRAAAKIVNHCQIYDKDGKLVSGGWFNLSILKHMGYSLAPVK